MKLFAKWLVLILISSVAVFAEIKPKTEIVKEAADQVSHTTVDELVAKKQAEEDMIIVDCRTKEEYDAGHIQNAIWIPRGKIEFSLPAKCDDCQKEVIVYCRTGGRASLATLTLKNIGYEKVSNLKGGFKEWVTTGHSAFNLHGEIKVVGYGTKE